MPLFHNTRLFLSPSIGCATFLLLFSACNAAHAENRNGDRSNSSDENHATDFDLGHGSLNDVTLTLNYEGKSYTIFDEDKPSSDLKNAGLHLSIGSIIRYAADAGKSGNDHVDFRCDLNTGNRNDDRGERDGDKYFSSFSHDEHRGDNRNNYFCDDGDKGHHNGGGNPNNGSGDNGNGGCGNNGSGGNDGGGMPATPEPSAVYLSFVAAGLMSLMLVRRNLRLR